MNSHEFSEWVDFHSELFSGFGKWFDAMSGTAVNVWREGLSGVALSDASQASKDMALGEIDAPPGYSKHLKAIAKRSRELAFERRKSEPRRQVVVDGQVGFSCGDCCDTGLVTIYQPEFVARLMELPDGEGAESDEVRICNVACRCDQGKRYEGWPVYEPGVLCRWRRKASPEVTEAPMVRCSWSGGAAAQLAECLEGVRGFQERNRVSAFDEWNEGE